MQKRMSRRRFLTEATAAGGATLLAASAGAVVPKKKPVREPYRPDCAEIVQNEAHLEDHQALTRLPVFKMQIVPHWSQDGAHFWYLNALPHGQREFIRVDASRGVRAAAFDHAKLAAALSQASGQSYTGSRLPFDAIALPDDGEAVLFFVDGTGWQYDPGTDACTKTGAHQAAETVPPKTGDVTPDDRGGPQGAPPDGPWAAFVREHNIFVRSKADGAETALTRDGTAERPYGSIDWAPDGKTFVAYRIDPVPIKPVYMVESSPKDGGTRGVLHQHEYAQPGDPFSKYEMWLLDPAGATATKAQVEVIDFGDAPGLRWDKDGRRFTFERMDRGYQRFRVIAVEAGSGRDTTLVDDRAKTFIDSTTTYVHYTDDGAEILYASERDGWRHLYLFDGRTGG